MATVCTQIVDGPREDGWVRYLCPDCGGMTAWVPKALANHKVEHYCRGPATKAKATQSLCVGGLLADGAIMVMQAEKKAYLPEMKSQIEIILQAMDKARTLVAADLQYKRDMEDGLHG